ncbi:MAG: efflux RND transporter permease subunit, partial [Planctomycetaceae bacterium]|nr:efflux RND transporter permease subunit [Planctomycetaceae bacterium]
VEAAVNGTEEVMWPVTVAVATTIAGFAPLMFINGRIGDSMKDLPLVVLAALSASLIEALLILPSHLKHLKRKKVVKNQAKTHLGKLWHKLMNFQHHIMHDLFIKYYERILRVAMHWRYVTLTLAISTCAISISLMFGGIVPFVFIQKMDSETITADLEMPVGTVIGETRTKLMKISNYVKDLPEVQSVQTTVGSQMNIGGMGATLGGQQSHLGQVVVELLEADERERLGLRSSDELMVEFRELSENLPGINSIKWEALSGGPAGKDIEIRVVGENFSELVLVTEKIKKELASYDGVVDLDDDYDVGKREVQLRLLESARSTGITVKDLGNFVRFALYGYEAKSITRNREDMKIMVRLPKEYRVDVYNIEALRIPRPPGAGQIDDSNSLSRWIPITEVAEFTEARGYTSINRSQQKRAITIFGDVQTSANSADDVMDQFRFKYVPQLLAEHSQVTIEFSGSTEERGKSFSSLFIAMPVAFLVIFMLLAGLFQSYLQPIVVMSAIPFGMQGAILGHYITGNPVTFLSCIGFLALSGILVNDSLVLVDFINRKIRNGMDPFEANVSGAKLRLRAIILTSLTTAAGLTPLMFETSFQAKFLIPMAVTLTYGLIFATGLTLIIVPCLNMMFIDVKHLTSKLWIFVFG